MVKLDDVIASMALKDDLGAAQLETVHQLRTEFHAELAPVASSLARSKSTLHSATYFQDYFVQCIIRH